MLIWQLHILWQFDKLIQSERAYNLYNIKTFWLKFNCDHLFFVDCIIVNFSQKKILFFREFDELIFSDKIIQLP